MEPTASGMFCNRMLSMVNSEDVNAIIQAQRHMLDRFEKTNEMLINFNGLSNVRLQQVNEHFLIHTRTLVEMKKDLDSIFRRIRCIAGHNHPLLAMSLSFPLFSKLLSSNMHGVLSSRTLKGKIAKQYPEAFSNVHETPTLEDDDDDFGLIPPSIATTTAATSEQSTESCDTSPGLVSPAISRCSEDLSEPQDTPTSDWPAAELRDEGPDSVPAE
ncbi:kxDL motif-containing protein 1 isoform X1 [Hypomesus transpacificus]|uniref:kxDL motif-containing protein 1 isoform X1 n=1 Tax=Hypomesus transpacificus TaxID=137520 RepID=UPI001F0836D6|nr:kxDL motif-containing protein 1 isoform X1 [Hypomesus transpacificus]XP_046891022.1 kxDL motif-containing protein 1 isoform X1 [Hypomesus transpacificus]